MQKRKKYTQEYKREAVVLARSSEVPISQVARELGVNANVLTRWCREAADEKVPAFTGQGKPRDEELASLKRELTRVKRERDFLREAAAFFARESKRGMA
jgi:transposase